jgi:hypothetical protein
MHPAVHYGIVGGGAGILLGIIFAITLNNLMNIPLAIILGLVAGVGGGMLQAQWQKYRGKRPHR